MYHRLQTSSVSISMEPKCTKGSINIYDVKKYKKIATIGEDYSFVYTRVLGLALDYCPRGGEITNRIGRTGRGATKPAPLIADSPRCEVPRMQCSFEMGLLNSASTKITRPEIASGSPRGAPSGAR
jgi:hypothetical protein